MNFKRILAIIAVILLLGMYLTTLILALCSFPGSDQLLKGFILMDIAVPLILWMLLYVYKHFSDRS